MIPLAASLDVGWCYSTTLVLLSVKVRAAAGLELSKAAEDKGFSGGTARTLWVYLSLLPLVLKLPAGN